MTLYRAIILTSGEISELLHLRDVFQSAQTPSHSGHEELDAFGELGNAQRRIARDHAVDPSKCSIGYSRANDATWSVQATYPLTPAEEEGVRGLG
jgi:hypothetical protein